MPTKRMTLDLTVDEAALLAITVAQYVRRNKGQPAEVDAMALLAQLSEAWRQAD